MSDNQPAEAGDITAMDDPGLLAERRRVRQELERLPARAESGELAARYRALDDEFLRRARVAWTPAG